MKKKISNKKMILIILLIILTIILLSNYIKTAEISLFDFFNKKEKTENSLLFKEEQNESELSKINKKEAEADKIKKINEKVNEVDTVNKINKTAEAKIESIALISEIKDPFNQKENKIKKENIIKEDQFSNKSSTQNLLFLEKDIITEKLKPLDKSSAQFLEKAGKNEENKSSDLKEKNNKFIQNIELPFKLLGIIKNNENSRALFLYQGKNIIKKENEKIDIFRIIKINNKEISITYQNKLRIVKLFKEGRNEEQK